jgi:hypothetical protein
MPNGLVMAAAAIIASVVVLHSILGERYIISRLMQRTQPKLFGSDDFTKRTLRFAWHVTTIFGLLLATILGWLSYQSLDANSRAILWFTAIAMAATALMTVIISRGKHVSWLAELAIAGLLLAALL